MGWPSVTFAVCVVSLALVLVPKVLVMDVAANVPLETGAALTVTAPELKISTCPALIPQLDFHLHQRLPPSSIDSRAPRRWIAFHLSL